MFAQVPVPYRAAGAFWRNRNRAAPNDRYLQAHNNDYDFDHPDSIDMELLTTSLERLKRGEQVDIPIYDFGILDLGFICL